MKEPHVFVPGAVYTAESLRLALGLTRTTVAREVRLGRLRVSKRAGRYFILAKWIIEWLEAGEVLRRETHGDRGSNG
jgi:hypothetical protein